MGNNAEGDSPPFGRALLTARERDILSREAEVKDNYRYKVESVARQRVDLLEQDLEVLREEYPELFEQIQDAVCEDRSQ